MKFAEEDKELNKGQQKAIDTIDGPLYVIAGPGTGKTELLSLRVANIIEKTGTPASSILCLTYTDAAAFNMRERLRKLGIYRTAIYTFHSFGIEVINRYPEHFYNGAPFLPADSATQTEILEKIFSALPYGNPLRSEHQGTFVYLSSAKKSIEYLKKAGLTSADFRKVLDENKKAAEHADPVIQRVFTDRMSKKIFPAVEEAIGEIAVYRSEPLPGGFKSLTDSLVVSLSQALSTAQEEEDSKPLTAWKADWTEKGDDKLTHLSDAMDIERMEALAGIYEQYEQEMNAEGYYDYDDMILDTLSVLEKNIGVRLDLQERFQYVLVDEFQDTNDAQLRLLRLLTDNPVHEGRPNIMVVGDDDQAIFKFQGADISNILDFRKLYRDPAMVVLTQNYRSTQQVLDAARHIIKKGVSRLENILPDLRKDLTAANKKIKKGNIHSKEFATRDIEYHWLALEIKKLLDGGVPAKEIAVLAREHKELEALVPHLHAARIPVSYERQLNVLNEQPIRQLITMARFTDSIMKKSEDADDLLPEILNFPFWGISTPDVWELSVRARSEKVPWLAAMRRSGGRLKEIADFFIELGGRATRWTAEEVLHELIGGPQEILLDDDSEDEIHRKETMFSPFRAYYSKDRFGGPGADYLRFLSSLRTFVGALREFRRGKDLTLTDLLRLVDTHIDNKLAINNVSPFVNALNAVQLMAAHKSKGLEFGTVFVINCQEDVWAGSGSRRGLSLPKNLPIVPAGDTLDDQLRLFYVATTRARHTLYLTSYSSDNRAKGTERLTFIAHSEGAPGEFEPEKVKLDDVGESPEDILVRQLNAPYVGPFVADKKALLNPLIENYQMSVTHLQNFLNVADAGPTAFLEKNLLYFPQPKSASGAFGSAVHETIRHVYDALKKDGKHPSTKQVLEWFEFYLTDERLNKHDFSLMLKRGKQALESFYESKKSQFSASDHAEFNFKSQNVLVGDASLAGKIDRISVAAAGEMVVHDFKTGRPLQNWRPYDPHDKVKAWKYRLQLIFYKLLIENSRDFGGKYSVRHGVVQFVEPFRGKIIDLSLDIEDAEVRRVKALTTAVFARIKAMDFPDISKYPKDMKGILAFEDDLLKG